MDFSRRGKRCDEQMVLLKQLWTQEEVNFQGEFDSVTGMGVNPLPVHRPIPVWIGPGVIPSASVVRRIGQQSDGWFVLCSPEEFSGIRDSIFEQADAAGRSSNELGQEAGVAVVGQGEAEWKDRVSNWNQIGLSHVCLRTLGGGLSIAEHIPTLERVVHEFPDGVR